MYVIGSSDFSFFSKNVFFCSVFCRCRRTASCGVFLSGISDVSSFCPGTKDLSGKKSRGSSFGEKHRAFSFQSRYDLASAAKMLHSPLIEGFYNLFLAFGTIFGGFSGNAGLVKFTLLSYIGAGTVLYWSTGKYAGALLQIVPAAVALSFF